MKQFFIIVALFLCFPLVLAFSLSDFFIQSQPFITGRDVNNLEPSVTLNKPVSTQVVNNPVVFTWKYFDPESDPLNYFVLQIDDDPRLLSPVNYYGKGEEFTVTLKTEGDYYWRVLAVNDFGQKLSDISSFYLDPEMKICDDGTAYFQCSRNKPDYCRAGDLEEDCQRCGCDVGAYCQVDGSCLFLECDDGTAYSACSYTKPFLCLNGKLEEACSLCGCPTGTECGADGVCHELAVDVPVQEEPPEPVIAPPLEPSVFEKIVLFFKSLFTRA